MSEQIDISILIPSYHEEENLRLIIPRLATTLTQNRINSEVIVIDTIDPSDNTESFCNENNIKCIRRENGNYYGDAVRTGIKYASGKYIIFMDADGSHSPEFILKLIEKKEEYDVVIASRYIAGGNSDNNRLLIFMSYVVNFLYSRIFGLNCKDVSNSFKLYNGDLIRKIKLNCKNFDIVEEILIKLCRMNGNLKLCEIPFYFKERMFGHTKRNLFTFILAYIVTIIKLKLMK